MEKILRNNPPSFNALCNDLEQALQTRGDAWRIASLATLSNNRPELRSVILRTLDIDKQLLTIYTDRRSEKVNQLIKNPECALLCWCPIRQQQLRLSCNATIKFEQNNVWLTLSANQRKDYATIIAPGRPLQNENADMDLGSSAQNFCVIECNITHIEWLQINSEGHLRARVSPEESQWICP